MEEEDLPLGAFLHEDTREEEFGGGHGLSSPLGFRLDQAGGDGDIILDEPAEFGRVVGREFQNAGLDVRKEGLFVQGHTEDIVVNVVVGQHAAERRNVFVEVSLGELGIDRGQFGRHFRIRIPSVFGVTESLAGGETKTGQSEETESEGHCPSCVLL